MYSVELKLMTSSVKYWNDACKKKISHSDISVYSNRTQFKT